MLDTLDFLSPQEDTNRDNWKALTFLVNAQFQEEYEKTTISMHTALVPSTTSDLLSPNLFDNSNSLGTVPKRKRDWYENTKASMDEDASEDEG